jgi:pimeloyl-ACP methyl ester carboxylesterase
VTQAAWESKRSWFVVTEKDRIMSPELQGSMAQQIGATVVKVEASHMPMLSKPTEVAGAIIDAARAAR